MLSILTKASDTFHRLQNPTNLTECKLYLWILQPVCSYNWKFSHIAASLNCKLKTPSFSRWVAAQKWNRGLWNNNKSRAVPTDTSPINNVRKLYTWHELVWQAGQLWHIAGSAGRTPEAHKILVTFVREGWTGIRHKAQKESCCRMGRPTVHTVFCSVAVHSSNRKQIAPVDKEYYIHHREACNMAPMISRIWIWSFPFDWSKASGSRCVVWLAYNRNGIISAW